ncbi:hypothetical protein AKJ09_10518 [Labilithrix luteola]|uniref:Uncharacterized protein n=1 Tax=Labilithrix luteola TaxID=1391654 RepID=A0A0K1QEK7_9BACT|nr:hypothetical protein AKJ09_10518 [Labilithrix luteola]
MWAAFGSWLGCNAILGNEAAVFDPIDSLGAEAGPGPDVVTSSDSSFPDSAIPNDGNTCVDVDKNPAHCGRCGHDCLGGACVSGRCQPILVASDNEGPSAIAIDHSHVYWTNSETGELHRAPIAGDAGSEVLYANDAGFGTRFDVHGENVYFVRIGDSSILQCPKSGCGSTAPTPIATAAQVPSALLVNDAGALFWTELDPDGGIGTCDLPCTGTVTYRVSHETRPTFLAVDGPALFWTTLGPSQVRGQSAPGDEARTLTSKQFLSDVKVAGERVFYTNLGEAARVVFRDGGGDMALPKAGTNIGPLATDGADVYFAEQSDQGRIFRCPVTGCAAAPEVIATSQGRPTALAVDAVSIYWTNSGATQTDGGTAGPGVMRLAK